MIEAGPIQGESALRGALAGFLAASGRGLLDELKLTGSNMAVRLAFSTQPYGDGPAARKAGMNAVAKDIRRVFATPSSLYKSLENQDPKSAFAFWAAYRKSDQPAMERIIGKSKASQAEVMRVPDPAVHQANRKSRGRVYLKHPRGLVLQRGAREEYIRQEQRKTGLTKAGWTKAADQLGGGSAVPTWASPKAHPNTSGGATVYESQGEPVVTIRNTVPWVSDVLSGRAQDEAVRIAEERLMKRLDIILIEEAKRAGIDSPF